MPDVRPFRGWRYDTAVAGSLDDLICPPYDVIAPSAAQQLLDRSPRNIIHLELGPGIADPDAPDNRYTRAAATLEHWVAEGALKQDSSSCFYVYEQSFRVDGRADGRSLRRLAFFAAVRLSPWDAGEVLPHEVTLSAPKADRLALLTATHTNSSPIYALCDGGLPGIAAVKRVTMQREPDAEAAGEAGEYHRLWAVPDLDVLDGVTRDLARRPLYIADGHHRYETALAYADAFGGVGGVDGADYVLMAITPVDDPGLIVLPTHRLLRDIDAARLDRALAGLHEVFEVQTVAHVPPVTPLLAALAAGADRQAVALYTPGRARVLRPRRDMGLSASALEDESMGMGEGVAPALYTLDVTVLQSLLLERLLGFTPEDLRSQRHVDYTRNAEEALRLVDDGTYQAAALLNGTPPAAVLAVARAGARMPQKSTYFYPKLATGLVLRRVSSRQ